MKEISLHIIAYSSHGSGLSGGDRIFIECVRRMTKSNLRIFIYVWDEGYRMCKRNRLRGVNYVILSMNKYKRLPFPIFDLLLTLKAIIESLRIRSIGTPEKTVIYSSSEFWMCSIPALILKKKFKAIKWIATFYLFASNPFSPESPYRGRHFIRGLLYYFSQWPIYWLIKKYADMVWVTNELDRYKFINGRRLTPDKVIAVRGGVDTKTPLTIPDPKEKEFDAVFIGRFHPQKGVVELIDIWKMVCNEKPNAKLAMIGVGELESQVREKIKRNNLENNIILFGFKDGVEKLKIFKDSKIVVHPAIYDSGGMAPCEAMACGLPGVSFDLPALRTYYPKGMLKTPCFDLKGFAENILKLLNDQELYMKLSKEAIELAKEWDWDKRAKELLDAIISLIKN